MRMQASRRQVVSMVSVACLLASVALAAERCVRPPDQDPSKIVTPHVVWGKPLAGGPIRVLAIVRSNGSREVYELAQRLDIRFDLARMIRGHQFEPDNPFNEGLDRLGEFIAKKPDVFLIGSIRTSALPAELHYEILKQVSEGAGLVCVNAAPWKGLGPAEGKLMSQPVGWFADTLPAVPYSLFRRVTFTGLKQFDVYTMGGVWTQFHDMPWAPGGEGTCYRVGKGRVAAISGHNFQGSWQSGNPVVLPATETPADRPTMPEYLYAMMAKAVRWAAGRQPRVRLTGFQADGARISPMHYAWKTNLSYVNDGPAWTGTLKTAVRGRWGEVTQTASEAVTLEPGRGVRRFRLRTVRLPAGDHTIDCWLVGKDKAIVDWGSCAVTSARWDRITIDLAKTWFEPTEPIRATFTMRDQNARHLRAFTYKVQAQIRDCDGRILVRHEADLPKPDYRAALDLRIPRPNGIVYYLEAYLVESQRGRRVPAAYALARFSVPIRRRDDYYVSANDSRQMTHLSRLRTWISRVYGTDCQRSYGVQRTGVTATAYFGQTPAPFFSHVGGCGFLGVPKRCLSAPAYRKQLFDGMKYLATQLEPFGATAYNLGDDTGICERLCKQPGCFGRFVEAMAKKYKTVAEMNRVWRTKLKRFADVTPKFMGDEQTAKRYGPWLDYLYWHEDLYCGTFKRCNDVVQAVDPHAWVGQDASGYYNVVDIYMDGCTYVAPYFRRVQAKQMGSYRSRPGFYGACTGTYAGPGRVPRNQCIPWDLVFAGNNAVLFWSMTSAGMGDLTLHPRGYQLEEIRELKGGIANLFIRAARQDDGIVLYHSRASKHATGVESAIGYQRLSESTFSTAIEDLGLQARWTSTKRAEGGEIARLKPKVVILPYSQALSDKEIAVLRQFVEGGGTLITDARPAVYTFHCQPRATGGLDDVFGIRRRALKHYTVQGDLVMKAPLGSLAAGAKVTKTIADKSVTPTTAKPLAELAGAPAVLVNRFGKGTAVLLNVFVGRFESLLDSGRADALRALYRALLERAGCKRTIVATSGGKDAPGVELVRFTRGPVTLLGVAKRSLGCEKYPVAVDLKLPGKSHVYDMRAGRYVGHTNVIKTKLADMGRQAYALVPYQVTGVTLSVTPAKGARAGDVLRVAATVKAVGGAGDHLVRFEAEDPAGRRVLHFRDKVWSSRGADGAIRAEVSWPLALNETPGRWTVYATDVLSGATVKTTVQVRARR